MLKAKLLRTLLENTIPNLKHNPEELELYVDNGRVIATGANSASFEYQYELNIIIKDFAQDLDMLIVPIMEFIRRNQPELVENPSLREDSFRFDIDFNNHDSLDISIYIKLTERVIVREDNGINKIYHANEPQLNPYPEITNWELYIENQLAQSWATEQN